MAIKLMNREYCPYTMDTKYEYYCDTDADFENLPTASIGSTAVSLESATVKVVNTSGEWVTFGG